MIFKTTQTEAQEYADIQADNALAAWAELDFSGINADIGDLGPDFDIDLLGIKNFSLDINFDPGGEVDQQKLEKKELVTQCPNCGECFLCKTDLKVDFATYEATKYAVLNWHDSECMPAGKLVKVGAWEDGLFIGVVVFGLGATNDLVAMD